MSADVFTGKKYEKAKDIKKKMQRERKKKEESLRHQ
jgi:hypothetical protein